MCLMPACVRARLDDPESAAFYRQAGPVMPSDTSTLRTELTEAMARAVTHNQRDLALGLNAALTALDRLPAASAVAA